MTSWSLTQARHTYSIANWGEGYFDIDAQGRLVALPLRDGRAVPLVELIDRAHGLGLQLPLLVRFTDMLGDRLRLLQAAFARAMQRYDYAGGYTAVYPIKVNQQESVVRELIAQGETGFGLEAGSKPELLAVLALSRGGLVVCNGYKDREYIRLALIGQRLGMDVHIVIEKASELDLVIEESARLGIRPLLGVRMRLASIGAGKWQNTGGDKAKFGLSPGQLLELLTRLRQAGLSDCLQLLHFHMGSQISNVRDIHGGVREGVRYFVELSRLGHPIRILDVGGGLGVDYEGTRSRSFCSINYGLDQYALAIVEPLAEACRAQGIAPPRVVTEAGRAMTAHHAVLITQVTESESFPDCEPEPAEDRQPVLRHLAELLDARGQRPPLEIYHEAQHYLAEGQAQFVQGGLDLAGRARLDALYYAIVQWVRRQLDRGNRAQRELLDTLNERLADKFFTNFSVFQSTPDVWAIDQIFPIVPLQRLNEAPTRRAVIEDLTCDSDGRIDLYVDSEGVDSSLPVHALRPQEPYRLGLFMVGAYQETLGDMHNLFGDTDSVNVALDGQGWTLSRPRRGDTVGHLLGYVGYDVEQLREALRAKVGAAGLAPAEARALVQELDAGLSGYTYLEEEPLAEAAR